MGSEREQSEWEAKLTSDERQQLADCGGSFHSFTEKAYWGCEWGCCEMEIKNSDKQCIFNFWTPLRPMSRLIGVRLKQKYPTLGFDYSGHDEFDLPMKPIWHWKCGDVATEDDARVAMLTEKVQKHNAMMSFIERFAPNDVDTKNKIFEFIRKDILEFADGDLQKGQRMYDEAVVHLRTYLALIPF
jgi:hypothetical protein